MNWLNYITANLWLSIGLYYAPAVLCLYGYTVETWKDYQRDKERSVKPYYSPYLTVGTIIGRAFLSTIPVANLIAAIFDVAPDVFSSFFRLLGRVFDQPIVPKRVDQDPRHD